MSDPFTIAVMALGLSLVVSAVRMIDWFLHSDPKAIAHTARWIVIGLAAFSLPLLLVLLLNQQWTAAITLAAIMVFVLAWYAPRLLQRFTLAPLAPQPRPPATWTAGDADDPALIQRSAAILEAYLRHTADSGNGANGRPVRHANGNGRTNGRHKNGQDHSHDGAGPMSEAEALDVLGLKPGAGEGDVSEAHRRLVQMIHPDRGGSHYLTVKINQAKEVLLGCAEDRLHAAASAARKPARRRAQRRPHP
jgi:hypothetical protein